MKHTSHDRLFAAFGIGSVVVELAGVAIGAIGGRPFVTITSSPADVRSAFDSSVGVGVWIGAYLELLSFGMFLAFAIWACARLGGGLLGAIAGAAATGYTTLSIGAVGVGGALAYRAGHGMDVQLATTLITLNEAVYVCTWFLSVFYLLAIAPMALAAGRRIIGWSAVGNLARRPGDDGGVTRQPWPDVEPPVAALDRRDERLTGSRCPRRSCTGRGGTGLTTARGWRASLTPATRPSAVALPSAARGDTTRP